MKTLFYNPIEVPSEIHIVSKAFGIDVRYSPDIAGEKSVCLKDLFLLAKVRDFDVVEVMLTSHNEAYFKKNKNSFEKFDVNGWISLISVKDGGGYLNNKWRGY